MKKVHKMITLLFIFSLVFTSLSFASTVANSNTRSKFKDVSTAHWAYNVIVEAHNKGIVTGYKDGTFKPNQSVSEAEFLSMLFRSYQEVKPIPGETWHKPIYDLALELNYPVDLKPKAIINRLRVAEIMTGVAGFHYTGDQAIQFMLGNGYANGKVAGELSIANYKGNDNLTRAEAVVFIANAKAKGITKLNKRPIDYSDTSKLPQLNKAQAEKSKQLLAKTEQMVKDAGYTMEASSLTGDGKIDMVIINSNNKKLIYYIDNSLVITDYTNNEALSLWADIALLYGAKGVTKDQLMKAAVKAYENYAEVFFKIGDKIVTSVGTTGGINQVSVKWNN